MKAIPGFPGYFVCPIGKVYSERRGAIKELKPAINEKGYLRVSLMKDGKLIGLRVHRAVLEAFTGPMPAGMQCCHIDGNVTNNSLENLMYGTPKENSQHRILHGTQQRRERHPLAKLSESDVAEIRATFVRTGPRTSNSVFLAKKFNVTADNIRRIARNISWIEASK